MRIYVAGRFKHYRKVREVIDRLQSMGHEVTYDWTRTKEFNAAGEFCGREGADANSIEFAKNDVWGVLQAQALVLCADDPEMAGAYIETGIAMGRGIPIYVIAYQRWTIFYELPQFRKFETYEDFFRVMEEGC
jgi:nucleoside 2-deoxyribosyltransferase